MNLSTILLESKTIDSLETAEEVSGEGLPIRRRWLLLRWSSRLDEVVSGRIEPSSIHRSLHWLFELKLIVGVQPTIECRNGAASIIPVSDFIRRFGGQHCRVGSSGQSNRRGHREVCSLEKFQILGIFFRNLPLIVRYLLYVEDSIV